MTKNKYTIKKTKIFVLFFLYVLFFYCTPFISAQQLEKTMFAGIWCPTSTTKTERFDESFRNINFSKMNPILFKEINKNHPIIIKKLGLFYNETPLKWSRLFTIVISRATSNLIKYSVKGTNIYKYSFDITLSLVVVNPKTAHVEYSRVLTGELPVLESKPLTNREKKQKFNDVLYKTLSDLLQKTAYEFNINNENNPMYYFQVTNVKIKNEAIQLAGYENDIKQFLHDALIYRAMENNFNVYFLPPDSQWDTELLKLFCAEFDVELEEGDEQFGSSKRENLLKSNQLLTVSTVIKKAKKSIIKQNKLEAYYAYLVYTIGAVVLRDINMNKIAICPKSLKGKKAIASGEGFTKFHDIKGMTEVSSEKIMFLDTSQKSLSDLSKKLIRYCNMSMNEALNE